MLPRAKATSVIALIVTGKFIEYAGNLIEWGGRGNTFLCMSTGITCIPGIND